MEIDKKILAKFKIKRGDSYKSTIVHYSIKNDKLYVGFKYDTDLEPWLQSCLEPIVNLIINESLTRFNFAKINPGMLKDFEWTIRNALRENAGNLGIYDIEVEDIDAYIHDGYEIGRHSWDDFHSTGLLTFVNSFLHIFGWEICVEYDDETKKVIGAFPARVPYRVFSIASYEQAYLKVSQYMKKFSGDLIKEANSSRITIDLNK